MNILTAKHHEVMLLAECSPAALHNAVTYINYIINTWMPEPLWQSWSHKGHTIASMILKIHIEGVLPTTNHLEAFNGLLKCKYIPQWQQSGSHLCFDFLIHIFVTKIIPDIFTPWLLHQNYLQWVAKHFADHTGGVNLVGNQKLGALKMVKQLCWWDLDQW